MSLKFDPNSQEAVFSAVFRTSINADQIAGDAISGVAVDYVGMGSY